MRRTIFKISIAALLVIGGCSSKKTSPSWEDLTTAQRLEYMRSDTAWIKSLDSLAAESIGKGAKCLDAVKHTFSWDGRMWVYNQDWGGVLEIPAGYVPEDDLWQAELSYHGSAIISPDSLVCINHYEGYQAFTYEEFLDLTLENFCQDSLLVKFSSRVDTVKFEGGEESPAIVVESINVDGIKGYFKYIYSSPESVEYALSVQYPSELEDVYSCLKTMIDRYPFGPKGQNPKIRK